MMTQMVKNLPALKEIWVQSLSQEDPLEKGMATHCRYKQFSIVNAIVLAKAVLNFKKEYLHLSIYLSKLNHITVYLKLTQCCKMERKAWKC